MVIRIGIKEYVGKYDPKTGMVTFDENIRIGDIVIPIREIQIANPLGYTTDDGYQRVGIHTQAQLLPGVQDWLNKHLETKIGGVTIGLDIGLPSANADFNLGEDGLTIGAGANLISGGVHGGNLNPETKTDTVVKGGVGIGVGGGGRLHWSDDDKDGHREYGFGGDIKFISVDVKTEDPVRLALDSILSPGGVGLNAGGFSPSNWFFDKNTNLTDGAIDFGVKTAKQTVNMAKDVVNVGEEVVSGLAESVISFF